MLNIIITAGGTSEKIDEVRKITNMSSGQLGLEIYKQLKTLDDINIFYITTSHCLKPEKERNLIIANSAEDVKKELYNLLTNMKIDMVIHSMAVSDYKTKSVLNIEETFSNLSKELSNKKLSEEEVFYILKRNLLSNPIGLDVSNKLSSNQDNMLLLLNKNPKIINLIKQISPETKLIGFKLLNNASYEELEKAAYKLMDNSNADYVIANDLSKINVDKDRHEAFVFSQFNDEVEQLHSKYEIAKFIYNII